MIGPRLIAGFRPLFAGRKLLYADCRIPCVGCGGKISINAVFYRQFEALPAEKSRKSSFIQPRRLPPAAKVQISPIFTAFKPFLGLQERSAGGKKMKNRRFYRQVPEPALDGIPFPAKICYNQSQQQTNPSKGIKTCLYVHHIRAIQDPGRPVPVQPIPEPAGSTQEAPVPQDPAHPAPVRQISVTKDSVTKASTVPTSASPVPARLSEKSTLSSSSLSCWPRSS